MRKLEMFDKIDLPQNERALGLLERINDLWEENSWLAGKTHQTRHQKLSCKTQSKLAEFAVNFPDELENLLNEETCLNQLVEHVMDGEEEVDD